MDDNHDNADSLALVVKLWGFDARATYDAPSALAEAKLNRPDVMLVDLGMPHVSGAELARAARRDIGEDVVLVAVSGYATPDDQRRAREAGFSHFLAKPADLDSLKAILEAAPHATGAGQATPQS